jgi:HEPN domain-containing protein
MKLPIEEVSAHIEEAQRSLRMADRDSTAFDILMSSGEAHLSVVCFHAQQAVEKCLKAVLFTHQIEFRRTHNLVELAGLLRKTGIKVPIEDSELDMLNPYAVEFRYDDADIILITPSEMYQMLVTARSWAETQVAVGIGNESEQ